MASLRWGVRPRSVIVATGRRADGRLLLGHRVLQGGVRADRAKRSGRRAGQSRVQRVRPGPVVLVWRARCQEPLMKDGSGVAAEQGVAIDSITRPCTRSCGSGR